MNDYSSSKRRRPRERGNPVTFKQRHWIPAFAGMTPIMRSLFSPASHSQAPRASSRSSRRSPVCRRSPIPRRTCRHPPSRWRRCCRSSRRRRPRAGWRGRFSAALRRSAVRAVLSFSSACGMNDCPPNPGFTDMISTRSSLSIVWSSQSSGVAGLNTSPALHPQSWIRPIVRSTCSEASGWKLMIEAPAFAKSGTMRSTGFTIRWTSIGTVACGFSRLADERPDREVRNVMVVHHVEVDEVGAGGDDRAALRHRGARSRPRGARGRFDSRAWRYN